MCTCTVCTCVVIQMFIDTHTNAAEHSNYDDVFRLESTYKGCIWDNSQRNVGLLAY